MTNRTDSLHIVLRPAPDLPGQWLAHCLEVDVVTQGDSLRNALEMIREAVDMVYIDDLQAGREPQDRRAPKADWDEMWKKLYPGTRTVPLDVLVGDEAAVRYAIVEATVAIERVNERPSERMEIQIGLTPVLASCTC